MSQNAAYILRLLRSNTDIVVIIERQSMPTNHQLVTHLFLQLAILLIASRAAGWLFRRLGQTQVVSEMISGVLLGPSFLGLIAPQLQKFLFPTSLTLTVNGSTTNITHPSMTILFGLSQLGLVLYMFIIGLEFNTKLLSKHIGVAGTISLSGVLAPLTLGGLLGFTLAGDARLFPASIAPWQAAIFMAAAMLITAFPMLARIIYENGISNTKIGTLAISAAAFDDAFAWILLAVVLSTAKNSPTIALLAAGGGIVYVIAIIFVGRPLFRRFSQIRDRNGTIQIDHFILFLLALMICAWFTDAVGIYSIFGAFLAGAAMPRCWFVSEARRYIEYLTVSILLPIFFIYSGLNTQLGLLLQPSLLGIVMAVIVIAFISKGGACLLGSRLSGMSWRDAGLIGSLMNARGLMELILINIGRDNGLITTELFTVLVLMTICTTAAASPLFNLLSKREEISLSGGLPDSKDTLPLESVSQK
jgi:Kef-type K+ transport system membrane component KefB